jgi:methylenetetrahydrofolate reductase (NADPH)
VLRALAAEDDAGAARLAGIAHAAELARELVSAGAPGIHVYTFNRHEAALDLVGAAGLTRPLG